MREIFPISRRCHGRLQVHAALIFEECAKRGLLKLPPVVYDNLKHDDAGKRKVRARACAAPLRKRPSPPSPARIYAIASTP